MKLGLINISLCLFLLFSGVVALAQDFADMAKKQYSKLKTFKLKDSIANERIYRVMLQSFEIINYEHQY